MFREIRLLYWRFLFSCAYGSSHDSSLRQVQLLGREGGSQSCRDWMARAVALVGSTRAISNMCQRHSLWSRLERYGIGRVQSSDNSVSVVGFGQHPSTLSFGARLTGVRFLSLWRWLLWSTVRVLKWRRSLFFFCIAPFLYYCYYKQFIYLFYAEFCGVLSVLRFVDKVATGAIDINQMTREWRNRGNHSGGFFQRRRCC